jgi:lysophospholipase L1-like esterase
MTRLTQIALVFIIALGRGTPGIAVAQTAAVAEKAAAKSAAKPAPIYDASVPGVGPIRNEDWFVKTWRGRRAHFAKEKAKQEHAIVFFGDSITQGWSDDFRGKFPNLNVANRGISGDTSRGLLARVDEDVLALDPSAIVLLIGTNDIGLKIAPEDIARNVKLLLEKIASHDPKVPVILCQVMPTSGTKQHRPKDQIQKLNGLLADVVRGNKQVTVLDTYTLFTGPDGDAKPEEFPDLLHPNDGGYNKWKAALWPLFATLGFVDKEADSFTPEPGFESLFDGHDLDGWGFPQTSEKDRAMVKKWRAEGKTSPAYPIVEAPVSFDGRTESNDGRYRAIKGRLVVTTPTEGRRVQQLATTRDIPGDFTLKLDFRATPNADSGVFIRGHQLQCRDYALAGPENYKKLKKYKPQDWNELVIEVKGDKARCTCNGELLEAAYEVPATGPIGLEGDRGQMEYRHIRIRRE